MAFIVNFNSFVVVRGYREVLGGYFFDSLGTCNEDKKITTSKCDN